MSVRVHRYARFRIKNVLIFPLTFPIFCEAFILKFLVHLGLSPNQNPAYAYDSHLYYPDVTIGVCHIHAMYMYEEFPASFYKKLIIKRRFDTG